MIQHASLNVLKITQWVSYLLIIAICLAPKRFIASSVCRYVLLSCLCLALFLKVVVIHDFVFQPCDIAAVFAVITLIYRNDTTEAFVICFGGTFASMALIFPNFMLHTNALYIQFYLLHAFIIISAIYFFRINTGFHVLAFLRAAIIFMIYLPIARVCSEYSHQNIAFTLHKPASVAKLPILLNFPYYLIECVLLACLIGLVIYGCHRVKLKYKVGSLRA